LKEVVAHKVFIGIGSNIDRKQNISAAITALQKQFNELQLSSVYETTAMGIKNTDNYYNLVVGFKTDLSPEKINTLLKKIEKRSGRRHKRACPLDLDLLLYDDLIIHNDGLDIPRQDIINYAYVAVPLAEIIGDQRHPETGNSFHEHGQSEHIVDQVIKKIDCYIGENYDHKSV